MRKVLASLALALVASLAAFAQAQGFPNRAVIINRITELVAFCEERDRPVREQPKVMTAGNEGEHA